MQRIKSLLIMLLGVKITSFIQAVRFIYLLKKRKDFEFEIKILNRFLSKGDIALDIGANGADWTFHIYKQVTSSGYVFAFEADPYYAKATELAIKLMRMKNVTLIPFGLSDRDEIVPLRIKDSKNLRFTGKSFIDKNANPEEKNSVNIQLKKLDSLIENYPQIIHTSLIKCDVEGYELFVFKGATEVLKNARPIIIIEVGNFEKHGYCNREVFQFFNDNSYTVFTLIEGNILEKTDRELSHKKALGDNRILIPDEKIKLYKDLIG